MNTLLPDIRYALRRLRKSPGFTAVAAATLALGIASTTAIFSVVDQVLLHPLPYPNSDCILYVSQSDRKTGEIGYSTSPANYLDWVAQNHVFSEMAASRGWQANLGGDRPERIRIAMTTVSFFPLFDVRPLVGRTLLSEDEKHGNGHVVVLSYGLWKRRFGGKREIVNHDITLNEEKYTVIGVMPPNFAPDGWGEVWLPSPWGVPTHPLLPDRDPRQFRDRNYLDVWARLKPGVTLQQARAEMDAIAKGLEKQYPESDKGVGVGLVGLQDNLVGDVRPVLYVLLAAVAFVLLIACANVANLLLARSSHRGREVAIRTALGASRRRIVAQVLTESILLALLGGALGALLAVWAVPVLLGLSPAEIRSFHGIGVNVEVLAFSLALSLLTGTVFGLAPALHAVSGDLNQSLKEGERGSTALKGRTRSFLVVAEIGLSLVLLIGAGLTINSFLRVLRIDPGFDARHLLVFNIGLPPSATPAQQDDFYRQVAERLRTLPGVQSAGAVSRLPLSGGNSTRSFDVPGSDRHHEADVRVSTPDYLPTMGIPLLKGRYLTRSDAEGSSPVVVVNESMAERVFPGQDPIGKYIVNFETDGDKIQIVGVVGNVRHEGLDVPPRPEIYLPFGQAHWTSAYVAVRTKASDPLALIPAVQNVVWSIDKNVPLAGVQTMEGLVARSVMPRKFTVTLLGIFAVLATALAAIGIYGVMSYVVSQRTQEIGIRMALGARHNDVLRMVIKQGMALTGGGLTLGIVAALGLTRLISGLLFGVGASDPATFAILAMLLGVVALFASYIPARRAAEVDPIVALRYE